MREQKLFPDGAMWLTTFCVLLFFGVLATGCYTESAVTREESLPEGSVVRFYLHDGSVVKTMPGNYVRVDNGYQVSGEIVSATVAREFEGVIRYADIMEITAERYDQGVTAIAIVFGGILVVTTLLMVLAIGFR